MRLEVSMGTVKMLKVHTNQNLVDMLTKVVPSVKFNFCLSLTRICSFCPVAKGREERRHKWLEFRVQGGD